MAYESSATCTQCHETRDAEHFGKRPAKRNGLDSKCNPCKAANAKRRRQERGEDYLDYMRVWREKNREKIRKHDRTVRRYRSKGAERAGVRFRLSDYHDMLERQDGVCAICGSPPPEDRRLHVDHNHETDEIRELLCSRCNVGIGQFLERPDLLLKAIKYLEKHS